MNLKIYEFSYGSTLKKVISKFISLIYNITISIFVVFIVISIFTNINFYIKNIINDDTLNLIKIIEICICIVIPAFFIIPSFFKQKVELTDKIVKVYRHCLFFYPFMILRGFNDTILINQIDEIYRPTTKEKYLKPIPVGVIDWDNMVIIKINNSLGTEYYMPVKNSDDFIKEVNKLRNINIT